MFFDPLDLHHGVVLEDQDNLAEPRSFNAVVIRRRRFCGLCFFSGAPGGPLGANSPGSVDFLHFVQLNQAAVLYDKGDGSMMNF